MTEDDNQGVDIYALLDDSNDPIDEALDRREWTATYGQGIESEPQQVFAYGNYLRNFKRERGTLLMEDERAIRQSVQDTIKQIDPEYKISDYTGTVDTDIALVRTAFGEQAGQDVQSIIDNGGSREDLDDYVNDAKSYLVDMDYLKFASLKKTNDNGEVFYDLIGSPNIQDQEQGLSDSLSLGAVRNRDLWQVQSGMSEEYEGVSRFKGIRYNKIGDAFAEASKDEDDPDAFVNLIKEAKEFFSQKDADPSALITNARTLLGNSYAKGRTIGADIARNRFQDAEIIATLENIAEAERYNKGEVAYVANRTKIADNIKITKSGLAIAHKNLLLNRINFQTAIESKEELTESQKQQLYNTRTLYLTNSFGAFDELFSEGTVGKKWLKAKTERGSKTNAEVLDDFLAEPKNYSRFKNRVGAISDSIVDSFSGLVAVLPALAGNKKAIDFLVEQEEGRQNRRNVAEVFGDKLGLGMDIATTIFPAVVDIGATALASSATLGTGGIAYLSAKQGAKLTTKGYVKSMAGAALTRQFGETAKDTALRLEASKVIKLQTSGVVTEGVTEAIEAYNNLIANKAVVDRVQNTAIFLTAANRSAGNTYATVYSNLDGDHSEKHDKALGAALLAGAATGIITTGFSAIGKGGLENAFLRGATFNQQKFVLERMARTKLTKVDAENVIRNTLSKRIKELSKNRFGTFYNSFVKGGAEEFVEEAIDDFVNAFIVDAAIDADTPMIEKVSGALYSGLIGGIIGSGATTVRAISDSRQSITTGQLAEFQFEEETRLVETLKAKEAPLTAALVESRIRDLVRDPSAALTPEEETAIAAERQGVPVEQYVEPVKEGVDLPPEVMAGVIPEGSTAEDLLAGNIPTKKQEKEIIDSTLDGTVNPEEEEQNQDNAKQSNLESQLEAAPEFEYSKKGLSKDDQAVRQLTQDSITDLTKQADQFGVDFRLVTQADRDAATERGDSLKPFQVVPSEFGNYVLIDPVGVAALIEGKSSFSAKKITRALMSEEIAHLAALDNMTNEEVMEIYQSLPSSTIQSTINTYYQNSDSREAARARLASTDESVANQEGYRLTQEFLRMEAQKSVRGYTTEQDYAFYRNNPSILRSLMRYLKSFVERLTRNLKSDNNNPYLSMGINRVVTMYNQMRKGFRSDMVKTFDPNNPQENLSILESQVYVDPEEPLDSVTGLDSEIESEEGTSKLLMRFGDLTGMLELPLLYSGKYRGRYKGGLSKFYNKIVGSEDPRLRKLYENEIQLRNTIFDEVELYRKKLEELVAQEYPDGNAPTELFKLITGEGASTRLSDDNASDIEMFFLEQEQKLDRAKQSELRTEFSEFKVNQIILKYEGLFDLLAERQDKAYKNAFEAQKNRIARERNDAIEQLGGFEADGVTPKGELAKHLLSLREKVDAFSKKIKELYPNNPEAGKELNATIDHNLGIYITKSYKLFSEAGYAQKVMEEPEYAGIRERVADFFREQYIYHRSREIYKGGATNLAGTKIKATSLRDAELIAEKEITDSTEGEEGRPIIIENMMLDFLASYAPDGAGFGLPKVNYQWKERSQSITKTLKEKLEKREDIPAVLKDFLGEEVDATGYNAILKTYMHVGVMASHQAFIKNIYTLGRDPENKWILNAEELSQLPVEERFEDAENRTGNKWQRIRAGTDERYDPFMSEGVHLYAPKDLVQSVQNIADSMNYSLNDADQVVSATTKALAQITGGSMALKTLGSVGFYLRNALGNATYFAMSQGMFNPFKMSKTAWKEFTRKNFFLGKKAEDIEAAFSELSALGIINDEVRPKMIDELVFGEKDATELMQELSDNLDIVAKTKETVGELKGKSAEAYKRLRELSASMDTFYKIYYYGNELEVLKKARARKNGDIYENMSDYDLKRMAADKVKATAQSYSQAIPLIKGLAKSPYGVMFAPFLRFKGEVVRIVVNTLNLGIKEIRDSNPVIKTRGIKRLTGLSSVMIVGSAGIAAITKAIANISDEEERALRRMIPSYLNSHTFFFFRDKEGNVRTMDMTYINPYSQLVDPFLRAYTKAFAGESTASITGEFLKTLIIDEYFDEQIFSGAFNSVIKNRDPQTGKKIWEDRDDPLDIFTRGAGFLFGEAFQPRTLKALREVYSLYGGNASAEEIFSRISDEFYPVRRYKIDFYQRIQGYLYSARRENQNISLRKNVVLRETPMSDAELRDLVYDEMEHRRRIDRDVMETVKAAQSMGNLTDSQIFSAVKKANFGQKRWQYMLKGYTQTPAEAHKGLQERLREQAERTNNPIFIQRALKLNRIYQSLPRFTKF